MCAPYFNLMHTSLTVCIENTFAAHTGVPILRWNAAQGNGHVRSYTRNLPVITTPSEGSQADLCPEWEPTPGAVKHAD